MNEPIEIPNKSSFKINEVCSLTNVKSYVLRFWESEFTEIAPLVSSNGIKLYQQRDIEAILIIKKLLFDDKLSIERAKLEMKILMPTENLMDESYFDFDEEPLHKSGKSQNQKHDEIDHQIHTKRILIESDFQKLILAKSKLTEIISMTEILHHKNNW